MRLLNVSGMKPHQQGLLLTILGVLVLTPDALLLRMAQADSWTLVFWRSTLGATALLGFCWITDLRSRVWPGLLDWVSSLFTAVSAVLFVFAIMLTSVANALVILASMPFWAAFFSRIFLGQGMSNRTWASMMLALIGILIVFSDQLTAQINMGDWCALFSAMTMAGLFVWIKAHPSVNTTRSAGFGLLLSALTALVLGAEVLPSGGDIQWWALILNGAVIQPLATALIIRGPRLILPAEVGLIMLLETAISPLWV